MTMTDTLTALTGKPLGECTNSELYLSLLKLVNEKAAQQIPYHMPKRQGDT